MRVGTGDEREGVFASLIGGEIVEDGGSGSVVTFYAIDGELEDRHTRHIRRGEGVGGKGEPSLKVDEINSLFGRKFFGNFPGDTVCQDMSFGS